MKPSKLLSIPAVALALLLVSGCAVGNQYRYHDVQVALPLKARAEPVMIGLGGADQRPYVVSGDKPATFIGLQRGGFGNPFNVKTASGRPFIEDVLAVTGSALAQRGYTASIKGPFADRAAFAAAMREAGAATGVYLAVHEWKTDIYLNITLHFDLVLTVLGEDGLVVAEARQQGTETIGGARMEKDNSETARRALATKLSYLFNEEAVMRALE